MDLEHVFGPKPFVVELKARDRWEAIDELVEHLVETQRIEARNKEAITIAIKQREMLMNAGIGQGIAVPHAMTDLIDQPVAAIGRSRNGIKFHSIRGVQLVSVIVLYLIRRDEYQEDVQAMANMVKFMPVALRQGV
jgi:mannitol/fructose-specific phosphotransferase system IIA component (Ntr-type)